MLNLLLLVLLLMLTIPHLVLFAFYGYYLLRIRALEKSLATKEGKLDTNYHQVVDNALTKERKILEDATAEANEIIASARTVTQGSKDAVNEALQRMVVDIHKEAIDAASNFTNTYQVNLKQLSLQSLTDFQGIVKELKSALQKEIAGFHEVLLPKMEKELDEYKQARLEQTDKMITRVVKTVSQELLNKTLTLDDHQKLVTESLDRAKKKGAFD